MTNGEKIKEIFPNGILITDSNNKTYYWGCNIRVSKEYWNAEYKEPTTKNNLGVDCISRVDAIQAMQDKAKKITNEDTINGLCGAVAILFDMPSVTPQEPFINKPCVSSEVCEHDKNKVLDKIDEIITDALDKSTDQKESQTLRWVLDKISEVEDGNVN